LADHSLSMKSIPIRSRAIRALRDVARFHFAPDESGILARYSAALEASGSKGETVGIYVNPVGTDPEAIVVTDSELVMVSSGVATSVPYAEIQSVHGPAEKQRDLDIRASLRSGTVVTLRIAGADGRFRDVYSFVRFLDRVLEDMRSDKAG
jgi:hypothetical protein